MWSPCKSEKKLLKITGTWYIFMSNVWYMLQAVQWNARFLLSQSVVRKLFKILQYFCYMLGFSSPSPVVILDVNVGGLAGCLKFGNLLAVYETVHVPRNLTYVVKFRFILAFYNSLQLPLPVVVTGYVFFGSSCVWNVYNCLFIRLMIMITLPGLEGKFISTCVMIPPTSRVQISSWCTSRGHLWVRWLFHSKPFSIRFSVITQWTHRIYSVFSHGVFCLHDNCRVLCKCTYVPPRYPLRVLNDEITRQWQQTC